MIESMALCGRYTQTSWPARNPHTTGTWNTICLADFGGYGAAPCGPAAAAAANVAWFKKGKWVHLAKIAFEKYSIRDEVKASLNHFMSKPPDNYLHLLAAGLNRIEGSGLYLS
ncbi:MAG: hypothetical protein R3E95_20100 [Thiolinea sp.]